MSYETVRKYKSVLNNTYYCNKDIDFSGYFGYDEQWIKINNKWFYRLIIFDIVNNLPIVEGIYDNMETETIKSFIQSSVSLHKCKCVVTDGKEPYEGIVRDLNINHQSCTFYLQKNIYGVITNHLNEKKKEFKVEIKKKNPKFSKKRINEKLKNY